MAQDWGKAITLFQSACLGQNKDVAATTAELSKYLTDIIAIAEPETTPSAVAIIMWHPSDNSMLKVFYANCFFIPCHYCLPFLIYAAF